MAMILMTTMTMMMAGSCHPAQFGRCELVGGGVAWRALHDDGDDDDWDDSDNHNERDDSDNHNEIDR